MKISSTLLLVVSTFLGLYGQGDSIFDDSYVHEIRVTSNDFNFWNTLTLDYQSSYPDVPYQMANVSIDGVVVDSIGVRQKGFASHFGVFTNKKSIKLDFNEFVRGKKYDGLKKINLNNGAGDPAMQRDKLCYDIMNNAGVSAPRTSYAKVFINEIYWGLYVIVEQIDKTFLKDNFDNPEGNLFKNTDYSNLIWLGPDTAEYQNIFELKTEHTEDAWIDFVELMETINQTTDAEFEENIGSVFNVELFLKTLAVDVATSNWDSYLQNGRNFYLYQDPESKKYNWIPWDYNFALGGTFSDDIIGGGGPTPPLNYFPVDMSNSERVLISRLLNIPSFKERYYRDFCQLLENNFTTDRLFPLIDQYGDLIREDIQADNQYVWEQEDFELDLDQGSDLVPGLKKFFGEQVITLSNELAQVYDCENSSSALSALDITINEFMASNDSLSGLADANGDFDDWIELYNNTNEEVDLSNTYLTDNVTKPRKWNFPIGAKIPANGFLIVWADKDTDSDEFHANFKLAKAGGFIMLMDDNLVLDSLTYDTQETNISYARIPNGLGDFEVSDHTYNENNSETTSLEEIEQEIVKIYPNPTQNYLNINFETRGNRFVNLANGIGQSVFTGTLSDQNNTIQLNNFQTGIYFLTVKDRKQLLVTEKITILP